MTQEIQNSRQRPNCGFLEGGTDDIQGAEGDFLFVLELATGTQRR